jgi:predicted nucleic acid-binding protein
MSQVLVDTFVWIEYFSGKKIAERVDSLIDEKLICSNKIILCELIPFLYIKKELELIDSLRAIPEIPLTINWEKIIEHQTRIIKNNIKRVGIPDLIILDNVIQNNLTLFTFDHSLLQLKSIIKFDIL